MDKKTPKNAIVNVFSGQSEKIKKFFFLNAKKREKRGIPKEKIRKNESRGCRIRLFVCFQPILD